MFHNRLLTNEPSCVPPTMIRSYRVCVQHTDGSRQTVLEVRDNHDRLRRHGVDLSDCSALTLQILESWGQEVVRLFAFEVDGEEQS